MKILFLHGLESGPHGSKYQALKNRFGDVLAPDCTGIFDAEQRLVVILDTLRDEKGPFLVVGSSMGGLMALLLERRAPELVAGMILCAPALHRDEAVGLKAEGLPPTVIIHGVNDEVVPISAGRNFGVRLIEVEDDHRLSRSMELILNEVASMRALLEREVSKLPREDDR
ncbi:alpha/beta hydrolase [Geothermobacter hydrogeniphilus]|uniref:AB hydrolase-1 domain-containing protein n=1 Tax=Geothermobacter hydrogeniphilus TaxID=1969733 RepID=A0A1X0XSP9_9BACT|nr:alpha/beta fold hydrolase [Geothermobacter hydrogeniphilus]ORJ55899.1 hypothetical protein B5V00_14665 [Geothermobacter hydrogeniphilus]